MSMSLADFTAARDKWIETATRNLRFGNAGEIDAARIAFEAGWNALRDATPKASSSIDRAKEAM